MKGLDSSFTAVLPLAASAAGVDVSSDAHTRLFAAYKREIARVLGMRSVRQDSEADRTDLQEPTRGEY